MKRELFKLEWIRPSTIEYPKVWRTFKARDLDSDELIEYRIQDLPESRFDDAVDHMKKCFLHDEPISQALDGKNDAEYVSDYEWICRSILQQKSTLVCFRANSDEIIGILTLLVLTKADKVTEEIVAKCKSQNTKVMYAAESFLSKKFNAFDYYRKWEFLFLDSLAVDKRFRGRGIGAQFFDASKDVCKAYDLAVLHSTFTSDFSRRSGEKVGFKTDISISYEELNKLHPEFGLRNVNSKELSLNSCVL